MQMDFLGLISPMALSALFTIGALLGAISPPLAFWGFTGCALATLILACPFFAFDVADALQVIFLRGELNERIATGLRHIFEAKGSLSREMLFGLIATFVWLLVWLDCLRSFWETLSNQVVTDLYSPVTFYDRIGGTLVIGILVLLLFLPVFIFVGAFFRGRFGGRRKRLVLKPKEPKESLSFEERMAALERIPLFSYLNDQERLSLLNEMDPVFFENKQFLVKQGEVGSEFFVLAKGHAGAYFTDQQGRSHHLADLQEGDAFGEIALIDDVPRTASIVSDGGCIALSLKKDGFDRFARTLGSSDRVKAMIRLTSFFRRHPLFSKLNAKDQAQLIDTFRFDTITAGEEVPDHDGTFRLIYSGSVRVDAGDDAADTTLAPDDCFGYSNRLQVRYFALEGTGLLSVRNSEFHNLIWEKLVAKPELFI
jgi:CRP-like cAMP-binding protein